MRLPVVSIALISCLSLSTPSLAAKKPAETTKCDAKSLGKPAPECKIKDSDKAKNDEKAKKDEREKLAKKDEKDKKDKKDRRDDKDKPTSP
jgi:hypothetical protein